MATEGWGKESLEEALFNRGSLFDFFQAVRLVMKLYPKNARIGSFEHPEREAIRFHALSSLASPSAIINEISRTAPIELPLPPRVPVHMTVATLGLTGYSGVLPVFYTQAVLDDHKRVLAHFLGIFNHRLIALQYRAWEKRRLWLGFDQDQTLTTPYQGPLSSLFALIGIIEPSLQRRLLVPDISLLRYAGLLISGRGSVVALRGLLKDYFRVPVDIDQFRGRWCAIAVQERARLGDKDVSNQVGMGMMIGNATYYAQASFRIRLGPLSLLQYLSFLPEQMTLGGGIGWQGNSAWFRLQSLVNHFMGNRFGDIEVELQLRKEDVRGMPMDRDAGPVSRESGRVAVPARLGWVSWLARQDHVADNLGSCVIPLSR